MAMPNGDVFDDRQWRFLLTETAPLSSRQEQICRLILRGLSDKQISSQIGIAIPTVRTHLGRVFEKLEVQDRTELVLFFMRQFCEGCRKIECRRWELQQK